MKLFWNNSIAMLYPEAFNRRQDLESLLQAKKIELRIVEEEALELSLASLAGYANSPSPSLPFEGELPAESCLVLSGLEEKKRQQILESLKEAGIDIRYKAVITDENKDWAFGALMREMEKEEKRE